DGEDNIDLGFDVANASRGIDYGDIDVSLAALDADATWPTQPTLPPTASLSFNAGVAIIDDITFFKAEAPRLQLTVDTPVGHLSTAQFSSAAWQVKPASSHVLRMVTINSDGVQTLVPRDGDA